MNEEEICSGDFVYIKTKLHENIKFFVKLVVTNRFFFVMAPSGRFYFFDRRTTAIVKAVVECEYKFSLQTLPVVCISRILFHLELSEASRLARCSTRLLKAFNDETSMKERWMNWKKENVGLYDEEGMTYKECLKKYMPVIPVKVGGRYLKVRREREMMEK